MFDIRIVKAGAVRSRAPHPSTRSLAQGSFSLLGIQLKLEKPSEVQFPGGGTFTFSMVLILVSVLANEASQDMIVSQQLPLLLKIGYAKLVRFYDLLCAGAVLYAIATALTPTSGVGGSLCSANRRRRRS